MEISLDNIGKRFRRNVVFKNVSIDFRSGQSYALLGANGSGKSTLMRVIAGIQNPSVGKVHYLGNSRKIPRDSIFRYMSFCAPGMEILDELTLSEFFNFHFTFKTLRASLQLKELPELIGLHKFRHTPIADFSSGMRQRVKLAQAIFADTPVLLLDEPCTNLDQSGVEQYTQWLQAHSANRLLIIASNDEREYAPFCAEHIVVGDYK